MIISYIYIYIITYIICIQNILLFNMDNNLTIAYNSLSPIISSMVQTTSCLVKESSLFWISLFLLKLNFLTCMTVIAIQVCNGSELPHQYGFG